ncbi:MAG: hypothetical protein JO322_05560 [Candidatus Eremiobacteraeota bacterium]|nr:hypothetical protein [Candidatus Eremiobacteraeota bacterium]
MISLSSTTELVGALQHARDVTLTAYTLPQGAVLDALASAAKRGAHVRVRLEGYIYKDDGTVDAANADAIERLRGAGADAQLVHAAVDAPDPMLHLKGAVVDQSVFLDDRNWPDDGGDTIVRDDFALDAGMVRDAASGVEDRSTPFFSVRKRESLSSEARLINEAQKGDDVIIESESFGGANHVYTALDDAAKRGAHVRVLVAARELQGNANEQTAIDRLVHDGAAVRVCEADEKFAVVRESRGWLGSANATAAFDHPDQLDWGLRTDDANILTHLHAAFESRWTTATVSS